MNVRCVWAGRVRVKMLWLRGNGEKQPFEVTLGEETQLADGKFTLESVRPEKRTDIQFKPSDNRFSFRSEEHTSELQSLMRISYAVFCLKKKNNYNIDAHTQHITLLFTYN